MTGAVALLTQWWKGFNGGAVESPAMAKALLVNTAADLGDRDVPNINEGWGRVDVGTLFGPGAASRVYTDQRVVLTEPGQAQTVHVAPVDPAKPLKATIAWVDPPGAAAADEAAKKRPALVNDLDLSVATPDGQTYLGNAFAEGHSVPGGSADRLNNVENVWLDAAGSGPYAVTVAAAALPGDGVPASGDSTDQDYALVLSNARVVELPKLIVDHQETELTMPRTTRLTARLRVRAGVVTVSGFAPWRARVTVVVKRRGRTVGRRTVRSRVGGAYSARIRVRGATRGLQATVTAGGQPVRTR